MKIRSYKELSKLETFEDRFEYLSLRGVVGESTFGFDRWINQQFYKSKQWKDLRHHIILRDEGCDLGVDGYEIFGRLIIHHMNPMVANDIIHGDDAILNPEYLITTTHKTHNAIHYGDASLLPKQYVPRQKNDTKLW